MNIIAVDIGNTNINIGLFLDGKEEFIKAIPGEARTELTKCFRSGWQKIPVLESSKEKKRDGVIVACSVKPDWTKQVEEIVRETIDEKLLLIGRNIPLPMTCWVDEPDKVGTDRLVAAAAAYAVVEDAVVVADCGTAVTIDLVNEHGIFVGGVICPGLEIGAAALSQNTAQLPQVNVTRPKAPYGKNTADAIKCGLYYSAVATLQEVIRRYAESINRWPQTVLTGSVSELIKEDCEFIDSVVPDLVVKGIVLAYQRFIDEKSREII